MRVLLRCSQRAPCCLAMADADPVLVELSRRTAVICFHQQNVERPANTTSMESCNLGWPPFTLNTASLNTKQRLIPTKHGQNVLKRVRHKVKTAHYLKLILKHIEAVWGMNV